MNTAAEIQQTAPTQEIIKPQPPVIAETPEEAALQSLEKGEPDEVEKAAERISGEYVVQTERLAAVSPDDAAAAPEISRELAAETQATREELQAEQTSLRNEFADVLQDASWRKKTDQTKEQAGTETATAAQVEQTKTDQPKAETIKQKVTVLSEAAPAEAEPIPLVVRKEMPGMTLAETKKPEEWKGLAEMADKDLQAADLEVASAHQDLAKFEGERQKPYTELEEKYVAYAQTRIADAEVKREYEAMRKERLELLSGVAEKKTETETLKASEKKSKGELDAATTTLNGKTKQYDEAVATWNDLQEKQMRKEAFTDVEQKKYAEAHENIQLLEKEKSGLMDTVKKLDLAYKEIVSAREEGEKFLSAATTRMTALETNMEKTQRAMETLRAEHERSAQEYSSAYTKQQEEAAAQTGEETEEGAAEAGAAVLLGEKGERAPAAWREAEDKKRAAEKASRSDGRIATFLKNRKSLGLGMAALGFFGIKRAVNGALDFTDTMLGHMISFIKSPGQFLNKFKSEFDARTKRQGGFRGTASTISWALFGGPEEAIEQRETKEQTKQRQESLEEKKRKVAA